MSGTSLSNLSTQSGSWNKIHDKYYRKFEIYHMLWGDSVELANSVLHASPNGGPLALLRDEKKLQIINDHARPLIKIYSGSGKLLSTIVWDKGRIIGVHWIEHDRLVVVNDAGGIYTYDVVGKQVSAVSLAAELGNDHAIECRFWSGGVVVISTSCALICACDLDTHRPQVFRLGEAGLTMLPCSWIVIPPTDAGPGAAPTVLLSTDAGPVMAVEGIASARELPAEDGPFLEMCASPKGNVLASFSRSGKLVVTTPDFNKKLVEFDTGSDMQPEQMAWCGGASVVLYWDKMMLVVGPGGEWIKYSYDMVPYIFPEVDGMRIVTNETSEFLECVPRATEQTFTIGSDDPAAILFSALEHFENKSPKADENIRSIREELPTAVDTCIEAAAMEFSQASQRALLRAAAFGKAFVEGYRSETFVNMCRNLRVLNAIRHFEIGFPITYGQFQQIKMEGVLDRLTVHHHHLLALRICKYMNLPELNVVTDWACEKVNAPGDDMMVCEQIFEMLRDTPGVSYAHIASAAHRAKRIDLATRLLDNEPKAADQVPLLLEMGRDEVALAKAVECGDTDLIHLVLLRLRESREADFFEIFKSWQTAVDMFSTYCRQNDREMAKRVFKTLEQNSSLAYEFVIDAYTADDYENMLDRLKRAVELYQRDKEKTFEAKIVEEQMKLHVLQMEFEETHHDQFFGLSLNETILKLLARGAEKPASRLRSDFKVTDKAFWWLRIKAIGQIHDSLTKFSQLEKLSKEKKSPIGYEPFAEVCIDAQQNDEAMKYIVKIPEAEQRVNFMIRVSKFKDAAEFCIKEKKPELLAMVQQKCTNKQEALYIAQVIAQSQQK